MTEEKALRIVRKTRVIYGELNPWIRFVKRPAGKWLVARKLASKPTACHIVETADAAIHAIMMWLAVSIWWEHRFAPFAAAAMFALQVCYGASQARSNAMHKQNRLDATENDMRFGPTIYSQYGGSLPRTDPCAKADFIRQHVKYGWTEADAAERYELWVVQAIDTNPDLCKPSHEKLADDAIEQVRKPTGE